MSHTCSKCPGLIKSESTDVDFRRLPDKESLATCKFVLCAAEAFLFRGIAKIDNNLNKGVINAISAYRFFFGNYIFSSREKKELHADFGNTGYYLQFLLTKSLIIHV